MEHTLSEGASQRAPMSDAEFEAALSALERELGASPSAASPGPVKATAGTHRSRLDIVVAEVARKRDRLRAISGYMGEGSLKNSQNSAILASQSSTKSAQRERGSQRHSAKVKRPQWRDVTENQKLEGVLIEIMRQGGKRLHLDLAPKAQAEASRQGIEPLRHRLTTILRRQLGYVPDLALALDIDDGGRLHCHGAIVANHNQEAAIKQALRQAAGRWDGPIGNRRQLVMNELDWPSRCAAYMTKHHRQLQHISGQLLTWTRPAAASAKRRWSEGRAGAVDRVTLRALPEP